MTDPGLDTRLRQHARRGGLMVALTMALTIAICVGGATVFYALLVPAFADLIPINAVTGNGGTIAQAAQTPLAAAPQNANAQAAAPTIAAAQAAPTEPAAAVATPPPFNPTHQISANQSVNFRSGPSTSDPPIEALPPATPLEYLNQDAPATNPSDAPRWMKFKIEDGTEGWIRQIDTVPYQP